MALKKKKGKCKKISPFPSPQTYMRRNYTHSSEVFSSTRPKKRRKMRRIRRCRCGYKRQRCFTESPMRRNLRIKQSIEHSIRSHIDRLADYRRNSMLRCNPPSGLHVCGSNPFCEMNPCASSFCSTKTSVYSQNKSPHVGFSRRSPPRRRHKKVSEQEIRTEELDQGDFEGNSLESEIKRVTESVQNFEKLRKEFLSSLEKVHAQVSGLRLPQAQEGITLSKQSFPTINKTKTNLTTSTSTHSKINIKPKKKSQVTIPKNSKQETKIASTSVMDNLSKMLMNTSQRPKTKAPSMPAALKRVLGVAGGIGTGTSSSGSGLMNLAQAFCSSAAGGYL